MPGRSKQPNQSSLGRKFGVPAVGAPKHRPVTPESSFPKPEHSMRAVACIGDVSRDRSTRLDGYVPIEHPLLRVRPVIFARSARHHGIAESDEWAMAMGRSIIAFARVEHAATVLVRYCTPDALGYKAARLDLSARLAYFDKLLRGCGLTTQEEPRWRRIYEKIDGLRAKYRTILAYRAPLPGPIEFTGNLVIVRVSHTSRRHFESLLTLPQIELAAGHIAAAHVEFVQAATEILTRLVAEGRLPLSAPPALPRRARRTASVRHRDTAILPSPACASAPVFRPESGQLASNSGA